MRKLSIIALALAMAGASVAAHADEYVKGGFEMGGAVNAGLGFQYNNSNSQGATTPVIGTGAAANQYGPITPGPLGEFGQYNNVPTAASAYGKMSFEFFTDGVQLNLSKSFGENIRSRVDLVFGNFAYGGSVVDARNAIAQAYVTTNIPAGNGMEFLIGHFFTPFGYEKVFRNENNTVTHSIVWALRPTNFTGLKFYYSFTDLIDLHFYAYNNMRDNMTASVSKDMPGYGLTLGFNWGDEGKKNRVGVTALAGPESWGNAVAGGVSDKLGHWTYIGDVDWNWHINDAFTLGGEALYRMDGANKGTPKSKVMAAVADLNYAFTDVWDGTLKVAYAHQNNVAGSAGGVVDLASATAGAGLIGAGTAASGLRANVIQGGLATQYQIADGAKLQAEFRFDYGKSTGTGAPGKTLNYGPILNFAYAF